MMRALALWGLELAEGSETKDGCVSTTKDWVLEEEEEELRLADPTQQKHRAKGQKLHIITLTPRPSI